MKVRIEIDTKTFVRFWLVVMGFGLAGLALTALLMIDKFFVTVNRIFRVRREGRAGFIGDFPVFGVGVEPSSCSNC